MSQCPICWADECTVHKDCTLIRLDSNLSARLIRVPYESVAWARYQVEPGPSGLLPLTFYINPPHAPLGGLFWLKSQRTIRGRIRNTLLQLVELPDSPVELGKPLRLYEASEALAGPGALARGRGTRGFFALAPADLETTQATQVGAWICQVQALEALHWEAGHFPGVVRQSCLQATTFVVAGEKLMVYDHRPAPEPLARVVVTEKITTRSGRRWRHLDLYPAAAGALPEARVIVGNWGVRPAADELVGWIFQSTSHDRGSRSQETWILAILVQVGLAPTLDLAALRRAVEEAAGRGEPRALCNALEDLLLALVADGRVQIGEDQERDWGRYQALRARAERTGYENEAQVAWAKAVAILARLSGENLKGEPDDSVH